MLTTHTTPTSAPNPHTATNVSPLDPSGSSKTKFANCKAKAKVKTDIYQAVTDQVIAALENGVKPWVCPWERGGVRSLPVNLTTGTAYTGINILLLWRAAAEQGFTDSQWLTYRQAQAIGAQVRKGEKGTTAIFYKMIEVENEETGEPEQIPVLKTFTVFNVQQIDGLANDPSPVKAQTFEPLTAAEALLKRSGARITEGGDKAFYRPSTDEIRLPERQRFAGAADFYATALHELVHWTGAEKRLDRKLGSTFGTEAYAAEELVAELGSAFLMADLGISGEVQHESYIASWLTHLRNDKRYIFKAASAAAKAHRFLMETK